MSGFFQGLSLYLLLPALVILPARGDRATEALGDRAAASLALVRVDRGSATATGNAVRIADRHFLTAAHTLRDARSIQLILPGQAEPLAARVVAATAGDDLALLEVPRLAGTGAWLSLRPARDVGRGADLLVVSRRPAPGAAGRGPRHGSGVFLIPARSGGWLGRPGPGGQSVTRLSLDAAIELGDSGSPVLQPEDGSVVGIITHRESPADGGASAAAFAAPTERAVPLLSRAGLPIGWAQLAARPPGPRPEPRTSPRPPQPAEDFYLVPLARQARKEATP